MTRTAGLLFSFLVLASASACLEAMRSPTPAPDRLHSIPIGATKMTPATDLYPPRSETNEYEDPVPLPYPVNGAGAEDFAFMMPDGKTLYLWFTPDPNIPPEKQLMDGVTGIYASRMANGNWSNPERIVLESPGQLALDGCEFVLGNTIWFCSARAGYTGIHWFAAEFRAGKWMDWKNADFAPDFEVGELHITADGNELYFHSSRPGGKGGYDIWVSHRRDGAWQQPSNLEIVNSPYSDGWPFVSADGSELWFTRVQGSPTLWRSPRANGQWGEPTEMFGPFAGEASLDSQGNVYFTHHFYRDGKMLEADIYMARRRSR